MARRWAPPTLGDVLPASLALPLPLAYQDGSGPLTLAATVTALHAASLPEAGAVAVTVTLGAATLHDADKGPVALDGLVLVLRYAEGRFEPGDMLTPHPLSEFQEAGLLDAVASALNALAGPSASGSR